ncbi:MAG: SUMF1/EgtB/PvdO family nonheme iron enzyme [Bacteroidota bacterium]|nr:SUMF1/EgtB/PvdO family nonheme iron enzyme [Bacteroidota bacterium]
MNKIIPLFFLCFVFLSAYSQKHEAIFTLNPELKKDQWGFVVLEKGRLAIGRTEVSVDDYLTFLEDVSNYSSEDEMKELIPSKECVLYPFINTEKGFKKNDPENPIEISWINEKKFLEQNNYPPKEKIKDVDNSALNPYNRPITGIGYEQANAFADWCTEKCNKKLTDQEENPYRKIVFRLPTSKEFEEIERKGMEACTYKSKTLCPKAIAQLYAGKNEKGCALYNCAGKDTCKENLFASKYFGNELYMVYGYNPNWIGLYNMPGNAAEMTSEKGIAKGGSYLQVAKECSPEAIQYYNKPEKWLGLRLIAEVVDGSTMTPVISSLIKNDTNKFKPAEAGDYLLVKTGNYPEGICVFENSANMYELNLGEQNTLPEKKPNKLITDLFNSADKLNLESMWTLDEKVASIDKNYLRHYSSIEYKKNGKLYRVCWTTKSTSDSDVAKLDKFVENFWKLY